MHSGADWTPRYGAVTFTVPDGWAAAGDSPGSFRLEPAATYALEASGASEAGHFEIDVYAQPALPKDAASCDGRIDPKAGHSVDALVAGLRANPALSVTEQPATRIGGHPARVMDLALKPSWRHACPDLGRSSSYLVGTEAFDPGKVYPYVLALADQERHRLLLVDIGGGNSAAVVIDSSDPTRFDELLNAATPIVQSFQFP
jgi:hypothetical protein